jgi:hypothetical protein
VPSDFPGNNGVMPNNVVQNNRGVPNKNNVVKKKVKKHKFKYTFRKIPLLLPTKICLGVMLGLFFLCIVTFIIGMFMPSLAEFMWFNVRNPYIDLGLKLFNNIPYIGANLIFVLFFVCLFLLVIQVIFENYRKIKYKIALVVSNIISCIIFVLLTLFVFLPVGLDFNTHNNSKINEKYFSNNIDKVYTQEDLMKLANFYKNKVMVYSKSFARIGGEVVYNQDLVERSVKDLSAISEQFPFLKGSYVSNVGDFSQWERERNNDGTMAYTSLFGVVVDSKLDKTLKLNTINHELCHTKGILRESEAEFCAYVAGISSNDLFSQYSAYYNAFYRITSAIAQIDKEKALDIEESFTKLCLTDEYTEVCNFYSKDIDTFVEGTDYYMGYSYRLRNYKEYKDQFMNVLSLFEKNFNAEFVIDDKKVNSSYIYNEIISGSKKVLEIRIPVTDDDFASVSSFVKNNQKLLMAFYQYDVDIEDDYPTGQEALEYYTKPFDMKDSLNIFNFEGWQDEYYYERVVRLLLEYHDNLLR